MSKINIKDIIIDTTGPSNHFTYEQGKLCWNMGAGPNTKVIWGDGVITTMDDTSKVISNGKTPTVASQAVIEYEDGRQIKICSNVPTYREIWYTLRTSNGTATGTPHLFMGPTGTTTTRLWFEEVNGYKIKEVILDVGYISKYSNNVYSNKVRLLYNNPETGTEDVIFEKTGITSRPVANQTVYNMESPGVISIASVGGGYYETHY